MHAGYAGGVGAISPGCEATPGPGCPKKHLPRQGLKLPEPSHPCRGTDSKWMFLPGCVLRTTRATRFNASGVKTPASGNIFHSSGVSSHGGARRGRLQPLPGLVLLHALVTRGCFAPRAIGFNASGVGNRLLATGNSPCRPRALTRRASILNLLQDFKLPSPSLLTSAATIVADEVTRQSGNLGGLNLRRVGAPGLQRGGLQT